MTSSNRIPFEDGHFDFVVANQMFAHGPDLNRDLAEIGRGYVAFRVKRTKVSILSKTSVKPLARSLSRVFCRKFGSLIVIVRKT